MKVIYQLENAASTPYTRRHCNEGDGEGLGGTSQEDEVRDVGLADMARGFEAVDRHENDAEFFGRERVADGDALVDNDGARGLQLFDGGAGRVARRLDCSFDDLDQHPISHTPEPASSSLAVDAPILTPSSMMTCAYAL